MSSHAIRHATLSVEEYLAREEAAAVRHEYVAGTLHALAGGSARHNRIAFGIARRLAAAAEGGPCRVYIADMKLRAGPDAVYYPDVMVVREAHEPTALVLDSPCLIVEVASPSTEAIDRREKLAAYTRIPSLHAYLVVGQDARHVVRHWRTAEGPWASEELAGTGAVNLPCPESSLTLDQLYADVGLPDPA
jgi:Uma2 family endonuclease